jgi:hypothetical protein
MPLLGIEPLLSSLSLYQQSCLGRKFCHCKALCNGWPVLYFGTDHLTMLPAVLTLLTAGVGMAFVWNH